jgi:Cytochrome P460
MRYPPIPSLVVAATLVYGAFGLRLSGDSPKPDADAPFHKELLQVAQDYKPWGRVDDEMRWAPELCRMPEPGKPKFSDSADEDTHGKKLYSLFAKKRSDYFYLGKNKTAPVGQVIVKESWIPEETTEVKPGRYGFEDRKKVQGGTTLNSDHFFPYVTKGDKVYKASKPNGLFIMMKLDPKTQGTDEGWVYGTVSADSKKVTAAGKVESCMKCHVEAKYDRQFWFNTKEK